MLMTWSAATSDGDILAVTIPDDSNYLL